MSKKSIFIIAGLAIFFVVLFSISILIAKSLMGNTETSLDSSQGVGLVEVKGMILDSKETVRQLRYFMKKENIKAVVLRVDSPGGVVAPSQEISDEVRKFAVKKKIIVFLEFFS